MKKDDVMANGIGQILEILEQLQGDVAMVKEDIAVMREAIDGVKENLADVKEETTITRANTNEILAWIDEARNATEIPFPVKHRK